MNKNNNISSPTIENIFHGKSNLNYKKKYHYTSPNAFLSILQNQNLRFTDARFMNDKVELTYFIKLLLDFIDKNKQKYPLCEECLYGLLANYAIDDIKNLKVNKEKSINDLFSLVDDLAHELAHMTEHNHDDAHKKLTMKYREVFHSKYLQGGARKISKYIGE